MSPSGSASASEIVRNFMTKAGLSDLVIDTFLRHFQGLVAGDTGLIPQTTISAPSHIEDASKLNTSHDHRDVLAETVFLKLNGGLGTSMGLSQAKSLLMAKDGLSFLDIIAKQVLHVRKVHKVSLPLVLMNSFRTDTDSRTALSSYSHLASAQDPIDIGFLQHKVPKLNQSDLTPVRWPENPELCWCPPGHGDLYTTLVTSGALKEMRDKGYRFAFVSNVDNLGATLDLDLLAHFAASDSSFMMEVTDRTDADRKGGHLAEDKHGRLVLRERAQCPADELADFEDIERFQYFNTNNIWIRLDKLEQQLAEHHNILQLPFIVNRKTVDPSDPNSTPVVQLETAMGSAIGLFPDATAVRVPRTRFAPVKTTDDLLAVRSDVYQLDTNFRVTMSGQQGDPPPNIQLDPRYYKNLTDFEAHFPHGVPSLKKCTSLKIEGDIRFGAGIVLAGAVHLVHEGPGQVVLEDNRSIEGGQTRL